MPRSSAPRSLTEEQPRCDRHDHDLHVAEHRRQARAHVLDRVVPEDQVGCEQEPGNDGQRHATPRQRSGSPPLGQRAIARIGESVQATEEARRLRRGARKDVEDARQGDGNCTRSAVNRGRAATAAKREVTRLDCPAWNREAVGGRLARHERQDFVSPRDDASLWPAARPAARQPLPDASADAPADHRSHGSADQSSDDKPHHSASCFTYHPTAERRGLGQRSPVPVGQRHRRRRAAAAGGRYEDPTQLPGRVALGAGRLQHHRRHV